MSRIIAIVFITLLLTACGGGQPTRAAVEAPEAADAPAVTVPPRTPAAATGLQAADAHPRLWLTAADLPRLRAWASEGNPLYRDGLALLAGRAVQDFSAQAGRRPIT